tara:strand:+ start:17301 stop:18380 length:1080 start_codon:yes stop_codon:yes gene_type:complete
MGYVPINNEKGMLDKIGDSVSNIFSNAKETVIDNRIVKDTGVAASAAAASVTSSVNSISVTDMRNTIYDTLSHNTSVLFMIILLVVITSIIGYIIYNIITDSVLFQKKIVVAGTEEPIFCNQLTKHTFSQILESGNGNKRTYCFWIYIFDIKTNPGQYKHVAHISSSDNDLLIADSSPYIILDSNSNKLYIRFPLKSGDTDSLLKSNKITEHNIDVFKKHDKTQTGFEINYIPLQRWVHVAIVINDIGGGGSITTYIDSLLNSKHDSSTMADLNVSKLNLNSKGTLVVGGNDSTSSSSLFGFSGLLSKFTMFNYDLNKNDIYRLYKSGPVDTFMTSLGLGAYGLRNPIYQLDSSKIETV